MRGYVQNSRMFIWNLSLIRKKSEHKTENIEVLNRFVWKKLADKNFENFNLWCIN